MIKKIIDRNKKSVIKNEGVINYPYLDTKGFITVGIGTNVNTFEKFIKFSWLDKFSEEEATSEQIKSSFNNLVCAKSIGDYDYHHTFYKPLSSIKATNESIEEHYVAKAKEMIETFIKICSESNIDYLSLPHKAQDALFDMLYNLGPTELVPANWPNLFASIKQQDWIRAAKECRRQDVSTNRNLMVRNLFLEIKN